MRLTLTFTSIIAIGACAEPVPSRPTWFADVQPILMANCGRCHGAIPANAQVAGVRLDRYVANDDASLDAWDYRTAIVDQAVKGVAPIMPPTYDLTDRQVAILERWVIDGAPKGDRANTPPAAIATTALPATVDQTAHLALVTSDADGDGLVVAVAARDVATDALTVLATGLPGGMVALDLDTGQLASTHRYDIVALVDDGWSDDPAMNGHAVAVATDVLVDHGARGTAPAITVIAPNGGETIFTDTTITWSASDPDPGDTLTATVELVRVAADGTVTVAQPLASGLTGAASYPWTTTGVPTTDASGPIPYRIRVTVTDGINTRSDVSNGDFTLAPPAAPTTLGWADVQPIYVTYCAPCPGQPARTAALESFRLDKYDASDPAPPTNADLGVYEMRSTVYTRMITQANMPPASAAQPSAADRDKVRQWILGGAPGTAGGGDRPPTFTWTTPNDTTITTTSTGTVTLAWSVSDPEAQPVTGDIRYVKITATVDQMARCDATLSFNAATVTSDVTAGTFTWALPENTGYYCLQGTVIDAAGQTVKRVAAKPVKYKTTPGP